MARQANKTKEAIELPAINEQGINEVMNTMTTIHSEYGVDRDLVNQLLGQAQLAGAFEDFSRTVRISKLAYVKENKLYQSLSGQKSRTGSELLKGTWEEFCNLLGMSVDKADLDITNLKSFGEEALESMSRMGIGYRELRQYRKLPEDQKTALIEVAKAGDKEALVELAEEFIAKNTKEKELLKKENENLKADYNALSKHSADIAKEKSELNLQLNKYVLKAVPLDERLEPFKKQISDIQSRINEQLEQQRQLVQIMDNLQKEIMQDDPNYVPDEPYSLPPSLQIVLIALHESLKMTLAQAKTTYRELWINFSDEVETAINEGDQIINETINDLV